MDGPATQDQAWPAYLGAASRTGAAADSMAADPQPAWRARIARGFVGAPAVGEQILAFAQTDRNVVVVDRATGEVIWRRRLAAPLGAGPLLTDDRLFVAEQDAVGRVYALRLADGQTLWSQRGGDVAAPLAVGPGAVYAGMVGGAVARLAPGDGQVRWRARLAGAIRAAPLVVPGALVVATATDSLYRLADSTGAIERRRGTRGTVLAAPALADSLVLFGTTAGRLEAVDMATLRTRWTYDLAGPIVGSVAVRDGAVWALTSRGELVAVPLAGPGSGTAVRRVELGLVARAGPMPAPGGVFVCAVNGEIVWLDAALARRWSTRVESPLVEPVLVDGRTMIVMSQRGDVIAFR